MLNKISNIMKRIFGKKQNPIPLPNYQPHNPLDSFSLPPGWSAIDSNINSTRIGNSINIGAISRAIESASEEIIEINNEYGAELGCGHTIYDAHPSPDGLKPGHGGICKKCHEDAILLLSENIITFKQAERLSRFCTNCQSYCLSCLTRQLCVDHTNAHILSDNRIIPVCHHCYTELNHESIPYKHIKFSIGKKCRS